MTCDDETDDVAKSVASTGQQSLFEVQAEIERDTFDKALIALRSGREKVPLAQSIEGNLMLKNALADVAAGVRKWFAEIEKGEGGQYNLEGSVIADEDPDRIAYLTIRTTLNCTVPTSYLANHSKGGLSIVRYSNTLCRAVWQERWLRDFRKHNRNLFQRLEKDMKSRRNLGAFKEGVWQWAANKDGFTLPPKWPMRTRVGIGMRLATILIESTGWFDVKDIRGSRRKMKMLEKSPHFEQFLEYWLQRAPLRPEFPPTVIPPRDWVGGMGGGYHTDQLAPLRIVKTGDGVYIKTFDGDHPMLKTVNAVQRVGWKVNPQVLDVLGHAVSARMDIGKLPINPENPYYAPRPDEGATPEELSEWRLKNIRTFEATREAKSHWLHVQQVYRMAHEYADFKAFYYPHTMDFRGRMYPVVPLFNPQGTDFAKGLLLFEQGKRIGDSGNRWLLIHGANCWDNGLTKLSFEDRCEWVRANAWHITQSAKAPLDYRWWSDAEEPWQFLAFCGEYVKSRDFGYVSHLPVGQDGTCNGLQHFSAMLRDPIGGEATNLTPGAVPADIYQRVADVVNDTLRQTADSDPIAKAWLEFGVDRKATKRQVMTLPYGSTPFSCLQYTREWYREKAAVQGDPFSREGQNEAVNYLSKLIWQSIGRVVVAAREAMDWLKVCSDAAGKNPVEWSVPSGFHVKQAYKETRLRRVRTVLFGSAFRPLIAEEADEISMREQRNGISPNFVHSLDAAHMAKTVDALVARGVETFAFVHDNYLSLAEDADVMAATLRRTFVDLHQEPSLDVLARQLREAGVQVPDPPKPRGLDLNAVLASPYFFA